MVIPQPEPPPPKTPWQEFKAGLPDSLSDFLGFIVRGGHMAAWCGERGIPYTTMLTFISSDPRRSEMYLRAREDRADVLADEIVAISDEDTLEVKELAPGVKVAVFDKTAVARNRLRVEARKWVAAKLRPRVYGDKLEVESTVNHKAVPDDELLARLAALGVVLPSVMPQQGGEGGNA